MVPASELSFGIPGFSRATDCLLIGLQGAVREAMALVSLARYGVCEAMRSHNGQI